MLTAKQPRLSFGKATYQTYEELLKHAIENAVGRNQVEQSLVEKKATGLTECMSRWLPKMLDPF